MRDEIRDILAELRQRLEDEFLRLAIDSPEFGDLMRQLVPEFYVYLVRLADGGHPLLCRSPELPRLCSGKLPHYLERRR